MRQAPRLVVGLGQGPGSAHWRCAETLGPLHRRWLATDYDELRGLFGAAVPLDILCARVQTRGRERDALTDIQREFVERWAAATGLDLGQRMVRIESTAIATAVGAAFAGPSPQWFAGRHHSPDLMLAASDAVPRFVPLYGRGGRSTLR